MLKKMMKKKNNKGFSLVELIVVILIMAVLAVALAPQVMKWVTNARVSSDIQLKDSVVSAFQIASASTTLKDGFKVTLNNTNVADFDPDTETEAIKAVNAVVDLTNTKTKSDVTIVVKVASNGSISGEITSTDTAIQKALTEELK